MKQTNTRKITVLAMLSALAFILTYLFYFLPIPPFMPSAAFLNYEPKDVIIAIAGFIYGPLAAIPISIVVSLLEMPLSGTGLIGLVMNVLSTCAFTCTAAFIYKKWRTLYGAATGLVTGVIMLSVVMILWNYYLTPLYMGIPREAIKPMLLTVFLPFNLIKGGLNAAITMVLYKAIKSALEKSDLLPATGDPEGKKSKINIVALLVSVLVIATCVLVILSWQKII